MEPPWARPTGFFFLRGTLPLMAKRAVFYVDGFNLYHSIKDLGVSHLKWFSIYTYADFVTSNAGESLEKVRYFSALATFRDNASVSRHKSYLRALKNTGVEYTLGQFKKKQRCCLKCKSNWIAHEEKETDVNIAVQIIEDAIDRLMDVCYVVSADTDLAPAIRLMKRKFPHIEYVCVAPPNRRHPGELLKIADRHIQISRKALELNRLPEQICDAAGTLYCPVEWAKKPLQ